MVIQLPLSTRKSTCCASIVPLMHAAGSYRTYGGFGFLDRIDVRQSVRDVVTLKSFGVAVTNLRRAKSFMAIGYWYKF